MRFPNAYLLLYLVLVLLLAACMTLTIHDAPSEGLAGAMLAAGVL